MTAPLDPAAILQTLQIAQRALDDGNLDLADRACRELESRGAASYRSWVIVAEVARRLGRRDIALDALDNASQDPAAQPSAIETIRAAVAAFPEPSPASPSTARFHVIRAWGQGFWSDVDHVIGQLLLAEWTGRTPIIAWGPSSRFGGNQLPRGKRSGESDPAHSVWDHFFLPVSEHRLPDVLGKKMRFFPSKFNDRNLCAIDPAHLSGPGSRIGALTFLMRDEDVTVSDFHTPLVALRSWIPPWHRLRGATLSQMYRDLVDRYIRPTAGIQARVDTLAADLALASSPVVAVHVRGTDKTSELIDLHSVHSLYQRHIIERLKELGPATRVLLVTDAASIENEYRSRFGSRLLVTPGAKTSGSVGLHFQPDRDGRALGTDVLVDVLLAARCEAFVGLGYSNVSAFAACFRDVRFGDQARSTLIGPHLHEMYNMPLLRSFA